VEAQLPDVVDALVELAEAASGDEAALAYLGAGPLEELLLLDVERHVDAVDDAARTSAAFRTALRCAWFDAEIDPALAERLRRFEPPL
jgi:hypothetical protein